MFLVQDHMNTAVLDRTSSITCMTCYVLHVHSTVNEILVPLDRSTSSAHHT